MKSKFFQVKKKSFENWLRCAFFGLFKKIYKNLYLCMQHRMRENTTFAPRMDLLQKHINYILKH